MATDDIRVYLPDYEGKDALPDREFFFNVLNTLRTDYMRLIIKDALSKRNTADEDEKEALLDVHVDFAKEMCEYPVISSKYSSMLTTSTEKKGKAIFLLKQGAKLTGKLRKPRKKHQIAKLEGYCSPKAQPVLSSAGPTHWEDEGTKRRLDFTHPPDQSPLNELGEEYSSAHVVDTLVS